MFCPNCNLSFDKTYGVKQTNCKVCNEWLYYSCKSCKKLYKNYCDMTMHLKYDCNKEKILACRLCDYKTSRQAYLNEHNKVAHTVTEEEKYVSCPNCERSFRFMRYLRWHMSHECGDQHWQYCSAPGCEFKTKYPNSLTKHFTIHTRDESVTFDCTKCGKKYKTRGSLMNHERNLCGKEPQLQCHHCSYRTYQKYPLLAKHIQRQHSEIFPKNTFNCRYCRGYFHHIYGLERHLREATICSKKHEKKKLKMKMKAQAEQLANFNLKP